MGFLGAFRSFFAANTFSTVTPHPRIYLRLRFRDPEGTIRDFPRDFPFRVRFGDGSPVQRVEVTVGAAGAVTLDARTSPPWRSFALEFNKTYTPYIVCEARSSPPSSPPSLFASPPGLSPATAAGQRYFALPSGSPVWEMRQADWSPLPTFAGNGVWNSPPGRISHTVSPPADIASAASPAVLVLDPHWKYTQFQFYDRFYGHGLINSPPAGHGRRIAIPPIVLEGFRNDPAAAGSPPDTRSNWTIGADVKDLVQCLPWILQRDAAGVALSPPLKGANVGLRFRTDQTKITTIFSQDANTRILQVHSPPGSPPASPPAPLDPGPDRLRYYDLPRLWKSQNYFARGVPNSPPAGSPPIGQFFQELNVADFARSNVSASPLIFSLDDIVLCDPTMNKLDLGANDRVTIFHHRFADRMVSPPAAAPSIANVSAEGVYRPGTNVSPASYPYSNVAMRNRYYITDYPDWTRLVMAQGNLWDVFGDRTSPPNPVVGARAAVRWVNATTAPNGVAAATIYPATDPSLTQRTFFAIQPLYRQRFIEHSDNPAAGPVHHDEWTTAFATARYPIGRSDVALIRCCDRYDSDEVAVFLQYQKLSFNFGSPPATMSTTPLQLAWAKRFIDNGTARFNYDATAGGAAASCNEARAWILKSPPGSPLAFRAQVLTVVQFLPTAWAHYDVSPLPTWGRSWMWAYKGTGELRENAALHDAASGWGGLLGRGLAAAHEQGHGFTHADEYREGEDNSRNWKSLHILGNPYIHDEYALMKGNWEVRARYFWYAAEWLRTTRGMGNLNLRIHHGAAEPNYVVPQYTHSATNPGRSFVNWPLRFNLRQRSGGDLSNFDSFVYALGDDHYSRGVLTAKGSPVLGTGRTRIDGMVIVVPRLHFELTRVPGNPTFQGTVRKFLFDELEKMFLNRLNFRFCYSFRTHSGAAGPAGFAYCLLHFVPALAATFSSPWSAAGGSTSPVMWGTTSRHMIATFSPPPSPPLSPPPSPPWPAISPPALSPPVSPPFSPPMSPPRWTNTAPPAAKLLRIDVPWDLNTRPAADRNAMLQFLVENIFNYACQTLGLTAQNPPVAGDYRSAASYSPIVRTVMDPAASPPVAS